MQLSHALASTSLDTDNRMGMEKRNHQQPNNANLEKNTGDEAVQEEKKSQAGVVLERKWKTHPAGVGVDGSCLLQTATNG